MAKTGAVKDVSKMPTNNFVIIIFPAECFVIVIKPKLLSVNDGPTDGHSKL